MTTVCPLLETLMVVPRCAQMLYMKVRVSVHHVRDCDGPNIKAINPPPPKKKTQAQEDER